MDKRTLLFILALTTALMLTNVFFARRTDDQAREAEVAQAEQAKVAITEAEAAKPVSKPGEKFYVLEDENLQLVFSNYGGAISQVNLPFDGTVREIGPDRAIREDDPKADLFLTTDGGTVEGGYYPLLRRKLPNGPEVDPQYYATNVVGTGQTSIFNVTNQTANSITFSGTVDGARVEKEYRLSADHPFTVEMDLRTSGGDLWLTSGVPDVEWISNRNGNALKYRLTRAGKVEIEKMSKPKPGKVTSMGAIHPDWISNGNGYFGILINPLEEIGAGYRADFVSNEELPSRLSLVPNQKYKPSNLYGYNVMMPLTSGEHSFQLYMGPYDKGILKSVDPTYVDARSFHGYFKIISAPFSKFLFIIMNFFHMITRSWAISIILLTVVLRLILYPLSSWSMKSMRRMQQIQPQVKKIQAKWKKEPRRAQQEMLMLYRKEKVNPVSGCLPLIIQMPFLIGMFDLLKSTYALRGAGFIPGWIDNLTAPDVLFSWSAPIWFFGTEFHLLPILVAGVMFLQQRFSSTLPKDKSTWTDQQKQQRMMGNVMVVFFAFMFYNFPSGLNLYWLSSMLLSIGQQWMINKQLDKKPSKKKSKSRKADEPRVLRVK